MPTHRQPYCLEAVMVSLAQQTLPRHRFEVIVVEDPGGASYEVAAKQAKALDFRYETLPVHSGRSRARNHALALARGEVVLFLDSDCYAAPDLLERHWRFHRQITAPGVLLGTRLETTSVPFAGRLMRGDPVPPDERRRHTFDLRFPAAVNADYARSAMQTPWLYCHNNVSLSRDLVLSVGGFDEDFGTRWGIEDIDLLYRVYRQLGRPPDAFVYDDAAIAYHLPHFRDTHRELTVDLGANDLLFKRKHPHFEVEIGVERPHVYARKIQLYRRGISQFVAAGVGRVDQPTWRLLAPILAGRGAGRLLYAGLDTRQLPLPVDTVTFDHGAPESGSNHHLLGFATTFPDGAFDVAVNVDIWRLLQWDELCRLVIEGRRIAGELVLVYTERLDHPPGGFEAEVLDDIDYLVRALSPHAPVAVDRSVPGVVLIRIRATETGAGEG
jgi:glycosyltransferase involved in cell wall biosynthesis